MCTQENLGVSQLKRQRMPYRLQRGCSILLLVHLDADQAWSFSTVRIVYQPLHVANGTERKRQVFNQGKPATCLKVSYLTF